MNSATNDYGLWGLVVLNSIIFVGFAYSFFKPTNLRDWRSFGAYSAFIVALFAEMYGFPLTIYLLSGWLGSKFPNVNLFGHEAGHLWWLMTGQHGNPHFGALHLLSLVFIFAGFMLLSNAWHVLYQAQRRQQLAVAGPYRFVRHPQYVGFVAIMFGFLLQWPTLLTLAMFPVLVVMYIRLAISEEHACEKAFGNAWRAYAAATPRFMPHFSKGTRAGIAGWSIAAALVWAASPLAAMAQTTSDTPATQLSVERGVTIKVTPKAIGASDSRWEFSVELDTHSTDLSDDLVQSASLMTDDGRLFKPVDWTGAAPGGHHREGVLAFDVPTPRPASIELRIVRPSESADRTFRWQL